MINNSISPIKDEYIEKYFKEKELNLKATLDYKEALKLGIATGSASAFSEDLATKEKIEEIFSGL